MSDRCHEHLRRACEKCDGTVAAGDSDLTTQLTEVLRTHSMRSARPLGDGVIYARLCPCGFMWEDVAEWSEHVASILAAVVAERLREAQEAAWDEGYGAGHIEGFARVEPWGRKNPYTKGAEQ